MIDLTSTPWADRFYMPAETDPHAATWMLWPFRTDVWRDHAAPAQHTYAEVAAAIARFEPVFMGVIPSEIEKAKAVIPADVTLVEIPYNDAWVRDNGPTFVVNGQGQVRGIDWAFNAWGEIYTDYQDDQACASAILTHQGIDRYVCDFILEGGSIHVDGEGTALITEECLLHPNRNPTRSKADLEEMLMRYLGVASLIWLGDGVFEDETNGHIDNLCCFVRPGVVALTWTEDADDPQYAISREAYKRLEQAKDAKGRSIEIVTIDQPTPMIVTDAEAASVVAADGTLPRKAGERLAASYINYYAVNGGLIVPQFGDPNDGPALEALQQLYPDRDVVGLMTREILLGGGNIHCITQQQPRGI